MKFPFNFAAILSLGLAPAHAQESAAQFDAGAARAKLSGEVTRTAGKLGTKSIGGADPVTKRLYTKDALVVTRQSGAMEERPYVALPLLFRTDSDELLDATSRKNVLKVAEMLKDLGSATFAIEGHASAEGDARRNSELSKLRAAKIQSLLRAQGVSAGTLARVDGFGSTHAQHPPTARDTQLREDRRVLVVRER